MEKFWDLNWKVLHFLKYNKKFFWENMGNFYRANFFINFFKYGMKSFPGSPIYYYYVKLLHGYDVGFTSLLLFWNPLARQTIRFYFLCCTFSTAESSIYWGVMIKRSLPKLIKPLIPCMIYFIHYSRKLWNNFEHFYTWLLNVLMVFYYILRKMGLSFSVYIDWFVAAQQTVRVKLPVSFNFLKSVAVKG